eukprot:5727116-Lingulodinium_polyedra.AAC.1
MSLLLWNNILEGTTVLLIGAPCEDRDTADAGCSRCENLRRPPFSGTHRWGAWQTDLRRG